MERVIKFSSQAGDGKEGLGLGLSIVKEIIELHGGKITVRIQPGEETTFVLYLPSAHPDKLSLTEAAQ